MTGFISWGAAGFALAAGAFAAFNPCGFALLPAYITMIVTGAADQRVSREQAMRRAIGFGAAMTLGFVLVFGLFGSLFAAFRTTILEFVPFLGWVTVVIGAVLVGLGVYLLRGGEIKVPGMGFSGAAPRRTFLSQVLYGISFALASLSCTVGPFLAVFATSLNESNYLGALLSFVVYALGMGGVVVTLAILAAGAGSAAIAKVRRATPVLLRLGAVLVLVAGAYVLYYGVFEVRLLFGASSGDPVIEVAARIQGWLQSVVDTLNPWGFVALAALAVGAVGWVLLRRRSRAGDEQLAP